MTGESVRTVVVVEYSQTGQLDEAVDALVGPLLAAGWQVRHIGIEPIPEFPFPWPVTRFFGVFPECVDENATVPITSAGSELSTASGDLVIFAYQVWYLAPSLPMRSVLTRHPELFADRDVLTLVACRNMWYSAAAEVQRRLRAIGARQLGTVAAIDTRPQALTLVTTLRWLLLGRRNGALFGRAGIGDDELERLGALGAGLLTTSSTQDVRALLREQTSAPVVPVLAAADLLAGRAFRRWGAVIRRSSTFGSGARAASLGAFVGSLGLAIVLGLPSLALARALGGRRFDWFVEARVAATTNPENPVDSSESVVEEGVPS
ncbi:hypothetical protein K7711_37445 [Nocardia sp. CA2R105]|uniref:hypothetical protein n=1 Tax=Nocardia coffeae TaxID=2873381 RepID=UPI001CA6C35F|nr:hypothetical protein [Nocardia coffeae]MBY8862209.1 hypothetical protein [Nocardia coffeae]